ncbi:MAG: carbohydrate kinase family protein [Candidatus Kerfeldbacteria bacterium]|nr:carbohydrate kinase family protein [Candidatus Kerfeldbacteria bacterium]
MYDVITIGAATRDVFLRSRGIRIVRDDSFSTGEGECFALGSKIDVEEIVFETGGGATNAAVTFARQGLRTGFLGKIGATDARGREILSALRQERIATTLVKRDRRKSTAYSVLLLTARGERTALVYRGASADFHPQDFPWTKVRSQWLYVSSLAGKLPVLKKIWAHAARHHMKIAWDPGVGELALGLKRLMPLLSQTSILHVNQEEAARLMGFGYEQDEASFDKLRQIVDGVTIVTGGTEGALAGHRSDSWRSTTHPIHVVDTTGAGDAFTSGFVATFIRSRGNIPLSLQFATANSESVIRHIGAKIGILHSRRIPDPVAVMKR